MRRLCLQSASVAMLALLLAGCLAPGQSGAGGDARRLRGSLTDALTFDPDWAEKALPFGAGHDHNSADQHRNLSTPNFKIVGYNGLVTDYYGTPAGGYGCGDTVTKNGRTLSVVQAFSTDVAFVISDVTDPTNPQKIGELTMTAAEVYDLSITPDQRYVLLATSPYDQGPDKLPASPLARAQYGHATFRDACTGTVRPVAGPEQGLPYASGVVLVDISNPRNPVIQDFRSFPVFGGHSVRSYEVDGRILILVCVPNRTYPTSYYAFLDILQTPLGPKLNLLSTYRYLAPDMPLVQNWSSSGSHDGFIARHPVTHQLLAYLAYGPNSLVIVNIDDSTNPRFVSQWKDWSVLGDAAPPTNYIYVHETLPMPDAWDGRHYTFAGEECPIHRPKTPSCIVFILDTTDPAKPTFVGAWTLPADVQWSQELEFSTHYIHVHNGTLFISAYHAGLWAVDVSTPEARFLMPTIGVFLPDRDPPKPPHIDKVTIPAIATVYYRHPMIEDFDILDDGTMVVYDDLTGLYMVTFDATHPAPAPAPWPLHYNE